MIMSAEIVLQLLVIACVNPIGCSPARERCTIKEVKNRGSVPGHYDGRRRRATPIAVMRYWAQVGSPGVCQVPGLAFVASCQQAIREFRVRLMERKQTPASWAAENRDGFL